MLVVAAATGACSSRHAGDANGELGDIAGDSVSIPHYLTRAFTDDERSLLRRVYGIENPSLLYLSDSADGGVLRYDTRRKECGKCYVNSYRVGFISIRRPGESWEELERRVARMRPAAFPNWARIEDTSTAKLDPAIRGEVERMLADARAAGYPIRVTATYRSPEREAFLMAVSRFRTHTLTSLHSYGRALDIVVGDGNLRHTTTRSAWIDFRRWVSAYRDSMFHILGAADQSWDWRHVEIPSADLGFSSVDSALARARLCGKEAEDNEPPCDFEPRLPPEARHDTLSVPRPESQEHRRAKERRGR